MTFLHGVEIVEVESGAQAIQSVRSSVIGLVGTAPDADESVFPLNTPVLVAGSRTEAAKLDTVGDGNGTLPDAMDAVFDHLIFFFEGRWRPENGTGNAGRHATVPPDHNVFQYRHVLKQA